VGVRRRPVAAAAAARSSGEERRTDDNARPWVVLWVLGEGVRRSAGDESERCYKLTGGGNGGLRRSGARRGRMATLK
jgi:hypothetical protein